MLISVNSDRETPFSVLHDPPLPEGSEVNLSVDKLSLETLLEVCVSVRSHTFLNELMGTLKGTEWEKHGMNSCMHKYTCTCVCHLIHVLELHVFPLLNTVTLKKAPLCLFFSAPLKYHTQGVVLSVDSRVGRIVATVEPPSKVGGVSALLEELEKIATSNKQALPAVLNRLQ